MVRVKRSTYLSSSLGWKHVGFTMDGEPLVALFRGGKKVAESVVTWEQLDELSGFAKTAELDKKFRQAKARIVPAPAVSDKDAAMANSLSSSERESVRHLVARDGGHYYKSPHQRGKAKRK